VLSRAGLLLVAVLLSGCGLGEDEVGSAELCTALKADLVGTGLSGVPTREQAQQVGTRLDPRVTQRASPALHESVVRLHQRLHAIDQALERGTDARDLAGKARTDARDAARACDLPDDAFLR
jgi:hypothetical protein